MVDASPAPDRITIPSQTVPGLLPFGNSDAHRPVFHALPCSSDPSGRQTACGHFLQDVRRAPDDPLRDDDRSRDDDPFPDGGSSLDGDSLLDDDGPFQAAGSSPDGGKVQADGSFPDGEVVPAGGAARVGEAVPDGTQPQERNHGGGLPDDERPNACTFPSGTSSALSARSNCIRANGSGRAPHDTSDSDGAAGNNSDDNPNTPGKHGGGIRGSPHKPDGKNNQCS